MGKRNVKADKEVAEQPQADVQPVQETAGIVRSAEPNPHTAQATPEQSEGGEKELQVQPEQSSGKQTDDKGNTGVDSETEETAAGTEGGGTGDPDKPKETTENRNRIAGDVFEKNAQCEVLYFTADLIPFFEKSDANRHAATLKDNTVVTINKK